MSANPFSAEDLKKLEAQGRSLDAIHQQIAMFERGIPFLQLDRACTVQDGIERLAERDHEPYIKHFEKAQAAGRVTKFVPASGAASRMFKALHAAAATLSEKGECDDAFLAKFIEGLADFAFYDELKQRLADRAVVLEQPPAASQRGAVLAELLDGDKMAYASLPKGLLSFHRYESGVRTAAEEHFVEARAYAADSDGRGRLHFTVSPEHKAAFEALVAENRETYETEGFFLDISYSFQKPETDTIAVDPDNKPFRDKNNELLFRPGGHGALIENLNDLDGDLIFIKNIDNVVPDRLKDTTVTYKKLIAGYLLEIQEALFQYLVDLDNGPVDAAKRALFTQFAAEKLGCQVPDSVGSLDEEATRVYFQRLFNRPLRVCGMVKNEGEPGGGPFWVSAKDGSQSVQIVESSQIDAGDATQMKILKGSTHFNPVDLVCAVRDYRGNKFDLTEFVDPDACFISDKSKDGKPLKALELPGLWNGAMANWNTVFVEVPLITFNPVKTVNDLLRETHQPA
ncbi:DUF4301 family protein [Acanthopleuribacter pedis]|uniref:DUF4301 family protein n=1 Tax=Acanthopleuribacter pedis TaxID=442870 RepID=A0A8J7QBB2_9BACT|nr:DUF4301 family protein [Acanthopleuribacter pedis]MBO1320949.1 DUF4301 family protein [Acanthopleuribacter pedis]